MSNIRTFAQELLPDQLPPRVYRFSPINNNLLDSLIDHYLWFASPGSFNDPHDCSRHLLTFQPKPEDIRSVLSTYKYRGGPVPKSEISHFVEYPEKFQEAYMMNFKEIINSQGICCFSDYCEETLMWSHYAKDHTGVALVFKPIADIDTFLISKVKYVDEFTRYNYFDDPSFSLIRMMTTKDKRWAYEREYRAVNNSWGKKVYNKKALTEIIFGCNASKKDKMQVLGVVQEAGYENVIWSEAYVPINSFGLTFKTIGVFDKV
nr:DUF2971 domain-containing protein [Pedobacter panaciterrae]